MCVGVVLSHLCSYGRRGLSYCCRGPIEKGVVLGSPLFPWSAWAQSLRLLADRHGRLVWSRLAPLDGDGSATVECPPTKSLHVFEEISIY
jgi:hypothetical protein